MCGPESCGRSRGRLRQPNRAAAGGAAPPPRARLRSPRTAPPSPAGGPGPTPPSRGHLPPAPGSLLPPLTKRRNWKVTRRFHGCRALPRRSPPWLLWATRWGFQPHRRTCNFQYCLTPASPRSFLTFSRLLCASPKPARNGEAEKGRLTNVHLQAALSSSSRRSLPILLLYAEKNTSRKHYARIVSLVLIDTCKPTHFRSNATTFVQLPAEAPDQPLGEASLLSVFHNFS